MSQKTSQNNDAGEKIRKYAIVVFLTILVWAWAFNDLEETVTYTAQIDIAQSDDSDLFVKFDRDTPVEVEIVLKGTASKINKLSDLLDSGQKVLDFKFNPESKKEIPEVLSVLPFLNESTKIRELGLMVESVDIESINLDVEQLTKKTLDIQILDSNGAPLEEKSIVPPKIDMYVKDNFNGPATITLSPAEIETARKDYVLRKPIVRFAPDYTRSGDLVQVSLPPLDLPDQSIQTTMIGYSFSQNLMGKYKIELMNAVELKTTTQLKATDDAFKAYKKMDIQIFVQALDTDENKDQVSREVIYNFPAEYAEKGQIRLVGQPKKAKFKLVPIQQ